MRVHDELDVFGTVLEMRENRCHMVQSEVRVRQPGADTFHG